MRVAAAWSDKIAVKTHEESLSYGQLDTLSNTLSCRLLDIGLKAGDRLVISLGNCSEFILVRQLPCIDSIALTHIDVPRLRQDWCDHGGFESGLDS